MSEPRLFAEYQAARQATAPEQLQPLLRAGVTHHALDLAGPAFARVRPVGATLFQFDPDSDRGAFILPVRVEHPDTPESLDPEAAIADGAIVDLVAFKPRQANRWALCTGYAEWLGSCPPQYFEPPPVALHRAPLDWLRADCEGLVCLAAAPLEIYRFLSRFAALDVADSEHAEFIGTIFERPPWQPEILVGGRTRHGG